MMTFASSSMDNVGHYRAKESRHTLQKNYTPPNRREFASYYLLEWNETLTSA